MIDVCSTIDNVCFRVILDATYDKKVKTDFILPKTIGEKRHFIKDPKDKKYSYQKCFVVLDENNNPIADHLFSLGELEDMDYHLMSGESTDV